MPHGSARAGFALGCARLLGEEKKGSEEKGDKADNTFAFARHYNLIERDVCGSKSKKTEINQCKKLATERKETSVKTRSGTINLVQRHPADGFTGALAINLPAAVLIRGPRVSHVYSRNC